MSKRYDDMDGIQNRRPQNMVSHGDAINAAKQMPDSI